MMPYQEIRLAQASDRDAVLAFCQQTWDWGDYIDQEWDRWLNDSQGALLVALADGQPIGISHLQMLTTTEGWLEGMRVNPDFRQRGIGAALQNACLEEAIIRGATTVRLIIENTNAGSIRMTRNSRFEEVGAFSIYRAEPLENLRGFSPSDQPVLATRDDLNDIIDYLDQSNNFPLTGGLFYRGFTAYSISDTLLLQMIEANQIYLLRRWDRLDGLALTEMRVDRQGKKQLFIGYIDGSNAETIGTIAYALRQQAFLNGREQVTGHIPDILIIRDTFAGAEYKTIEKLFYTFERRFPVLPNAQT